MYSSSLAKRGIVLLFLIIAVFYFYGLGHLPFLGPDEPRYAQVAREMFLRGDLITPTLGGHTWFEKPALLYWMMILSFKLFGVSEWSARLPAAISGVLTIAAVFVVGRRVETEKSLASNGYALWSAVATATMLGIVGFSRAASFDILLTMTITWTLGFYLLYEFSAVDSKPRNWLLVGFYCFVGVSLLAKGLVGIVIPAGVLGLFHLFQRRLPRKNVLYSMLWGPPLALLVAGLWYFPVTWRHGWVFIDQFFIQHHFARYISNKYHHSQPVYYYLIVVPLLVLPWTTFLAAGLTQFKSWVWPRRAHDDQTDPTLKLLLPFALSWFLFPLVFFSFSGSKLPGYILPILPAAALIVGKQLSELRQDFVSWQLRVTAAIYLVIAIGVIAYSWRTGDFPIKFAFLTAAPLFVAASVPFVSTRRPDVSVALMAALTVVTLIAAAHWVAPRLAELESSRRLLQLADERGYSQTAIYGMQRSDRTPEFYAAGRIVYGADGEPVMYESGGQIIEESRKRQEVLLTFVPVGQVEQLTRFAPTETEVIGNNGRYAIVAVRAR
ncbi:MAG TPA: glycosyltransferase family 39 protein [Pyrinomonadaceae bacterium]|nr:glycosyltransferase family 39 protein [Pyrinomonadaceae bacterium]